MNVRAKGAAFERRKARSFSRVFPGVKRTGFMQSQRGGGFPDIGPTPGFWVECKKVKKIFAVTVFEEFLKFMPEGRRSLLRIKSRGSVLGTLVLLKEDCFFELLEGKEVGSNFFKSRIQSFSKLGAEKFLKQSIRDAKKHSGGDCPIVVMEQNGSSFSTVMMLERDFQEFEIDF